LRNECRHVVGIFHANQVGGQELQPPETHTLHVPHNVDAPASPHLRVAVLGCNQHAGLASRLPADHVELVELDERRWRLAGHTEACCDYACLVCITEGLHVASAFILFRRHQLCERKILLPFGVELSKHALAPRRAPPSFGLHPCHPGTKWMADSQGRERTATGHVESAMTS
jgi:hypothetical protein